MQTAFRYIIAAAFDQIASHLQEVKPTIMTAVPRLFEQVYHKIVKKGKAAGGWKTKLFEWALEVGQEYWAVKDNARLECRRSLAAKHALANRLVFSKWRDGVGGSTYDFLFRAERRFRKNCRTLSGRPAFRSCKATA